jgi:hypothetical protein
VRLYALAATLVLAGLGGTAAASRSDASKGPTLRHILAQPGEESALAGGDSDFAVGEVRFSFLIIRHDGKPIYQPTARVWVATSLDAKPFIQTTATLEPIGLPGTSEAAAGGVTKLYVTRFTAPRAGKLWLVTEPVGGQPIQGYANVIVKARSYSPAIGSRAIPSKTPTLATEHDVAKLTTRVPPDFGLLGYSVAGSLAAHKPFVVTFATPKFCTSRTCGPVVDVVDAVRKQLKGAGVRFIHVEVYKDNDPQKGPNAWFKQWHLPSEPWTFLVGSDGRIKAKLEGSFSTDELAAAVRRFLVS